VDNNAMFFMQFIPGCITLVLSVWGVLLWANMTEQCHHFYEAEYPNLLLLFKISVILGVISFVGVLCMLCVLGSVLVMGLSQMNSGTGAGYHDIHADSMDGGGGGGGAPGSAPNNAKETEDYV
jgi:hypothetical protein